MKQHIVLLDGAVDTMIQQHNLTEVVLHWILNHVPELMLHCLIFIAHKYPPFRVFDEADGFSPSFLIAIFSFPAETEEFSHFIFPKHFEP